MPHDISTTRDWYRHDLLAGCTSGSDAGALAWQSFGIIAKHVAEIGLERSKDHEIFEAARRFGSIVIVSKDSDFVDLVTLRGAPPQVVWLTCGNLATPAMHVLLSQQFPEALRLLEAGEPWVEIG